MGGGRATAAGPGATNSERMASILRDKKNFKTYIQSDEFMMDSKKYNRPLV